MNKERTASPRSRGASSSKEEWYDEEGYPDFSEDEDSESEDTDDDPNVSLESQTFSEEEMKTVAETGVYRRRNSCRIADKRPVRAQPDVQKSSKDKEEKKGCFSQGWIRLVLPCVIVLAIALWQYSVWSEESANAETLREEDRFKIFADDLRVISKKFPHQNRRSWLDIKAGVTDVMNESAKPWTFVLFSNETARISCLAELLAAASGKALRSGGSLILRPSDLGDEYGDTINRLRPLILEKKAVVVHDLLNVDAGAIQAFHSMCDRENPLVKEAIYILTLIAPGYTLSQKPEVFVETLLIDKFVNRVEDDKLQPLVTRLTDGPIIPVVPGNLPAGCVS